MVIFKDYNLEWGILSKQNVKERKHLMWRYGGIPMLDANLWDKYAPTIKKIKITTDKGRVFQISKESFEANKQEENYGYGRQYYVSKDKWTIK